MKIALIGYGKMGKMIEQIALSRGHEIVCIIDIDNQDDFESDAFKSADVAIEFTAPMVAYNNYLRAFKAGVKVVSGSTGWIKEHGDDVKKLIEQGNTLFWASNFSVGVAIFSAVNKYLAKIMNQFPDYDVKMEEVHHIHKLDHPSGTGITLAEQIVDNLDRKNGWEIGTLTAPDGTVSGEAGHAADKLVIDSVRRGEVPGIHSITYNYLIEHSAGSGKSNSLTWLAYKLIKTCPYTMEAVRAKAVDAPLFNSVIVVTDRRLLDKQISDNIKMFGQSTKIVAHADTSKDLKEAIESNKRIIITTIQKFPFICDAISDVSDHNFAVIIDEAHSSQSGIAADKLNATVQKDADTDGSDTDALLEKLMKDRKMSTNCSYFAFTATPKRETLERFGSEDAEGKFHPYHLYSMKQAIEEGFILDVLTNYTTYRSYYELTKSIEDNPEYNNERAQKKLRGAVERDPKTIAAKADVMLTHFDAKVFRSHKLKGKAKAMVVTKDIECAIKYYQALNRIVVDKELPYKILIAFSGEKRLQHQEASIYPITENLYGSIAAEKSGTAWSDYTEAGMNGFPNSQTAEKFDSDDYRILVVANKYLTGFDQPKLCAMYVDKPLAGVLAVQALSRLNRSAPDLGKLSEDLFILDFYNTQDDIKEAFDPFYTSTTLSEATDVNILHELKNTLLSFGVFDMDEVDAFISLYIHGANADQWAPIIDAAADRFNFEIDWPENGKADFKMKCKQFVRIYSRVAAIMPFEMKDWEKLFWFLRYLIPGLHIAGPDIDSLKDLLDSVDLNTYGLRRTALNEAITLDAGETTIDPLKPTMVNAGSEEEDKDPLDVILQEFNNRWFNGWEATPDDQKMKLISVAQAVAEDEDYKSLVVGNPDQQAVDALMVQIIDRIIRKKRKGDMSLYKEYQQNEGFKVDFRSVITHMLSDLDYLQA